MIDETINNLVFLKDSIGKFKNEIQKFIADPSYANHNVLNLRQSIEELEKNIIKKEKNIASQILNNNPARGNHTTLNQDSNHLNPFDRIENLPDIYSLNNYNTLKYVKRQDKAKLDKIRQNPHSAFNFSNQNAILKIEKEEHKNKLRSRRAIDPIHDMIDQRKFINSNRKETARLSEKYGINDEKSNFKIKRNVGCVNYMDKSKLLKYANSNRANYYQGVLYDANKRPIITQEEMNRGMLNMIYKGLVPKNADLTPAFNREGNPFTLTNKVRDIYTKSNVKDIVETETQEMVNIKLKQESVFLTAQMEIEKSNFSKNNSNNENVYDGEKSFINNPENTSMMQNNSGTKKENQKDTTNTKSKNYYNNSNINDPTSRIKTENTELQQEEILKEFLTHQSLNLLFLNFKVTDNDEFRNFKTKNQDKWGIIIYLIEHLQKLFKKLNFSAVDVDGYKLEKLATDELRSFTIKDFLNCISEKDLIAKGINLHNTRLLSTNIRDIFIIKIQNMVRMFLARKKAKFLAQIVKCCSKIQRMWRLYKLMKQSKALMSDYFQESHEQWKQMMRLFKLKWPEIKNNSRIEIHMNSLSYSGYKNCTIEKFQEKENNQLSRLISLMDPNVEIIYISPFNLGNEVLSYYFSILQTLGIENAKERFHLIVPTMSSVLPPHYCLSQCLLYSTQSIKKIQKFIKNREMQCYIVPGKVSLHDLKLSMYLECPILLDDYDMTRTLFTKSGSKRVFELMNMALPISAWDIRTEDEFYNSLTLLIKNYLSVNIWIFKIDTEHAGRGIAYVNLDKIKSFVELKKDRLNNVLVDESKFESGLKDILRRAIPKKAEIITNKLYKSWDEFFEEFSRCKGVIESCPTGSLSGIIGNPCISFMIEPDGNLSEICSYDKLNVNYFRNFGLISPQQTIPNLVSN
jgi:IQ domain-containing protein H